MEDNKKLTWHTEKRKLGELIEWDKNPRQLKDHDAEHLKKSLDNFGVADPLIINTDNRIIGGHMRRRIMLQSGYKPDDLVDVRVPERELTEREAEELAIRLNKNTGDWDFDALANNFELDDLLDWGFDKQELDLDLWADEPPEDVEPQLDKAEELRVKWGVESGQLWQLGEHRLICGDCTDERNIVTVMQGEQANLCFTSPPYWVGKNYETQDSVEAINNFIKAVSVCIDKAVKKDESRIVINTGTGFTTSFDKRQKRQTLLLIDKWTNCFYELKWNLRHVRHWLKHGQLMSIGAKSDMIDQHCEWLATYEADEGKEMDFTDRLDENEVESLLTFYHIGGHGRGRGQESVKNYKDAKKWALSGYWDDIHGNANSDNHCAAFPLELVERHMVLYSKKDEFVYEPFLGSGTTLIACERLGRKCRAVEISPAYCAVAIQRWVDVTGKEPMLLTL